VGKGTMLVDVKKENFNSSLWSNWNIKRRN